MHVHVGSKNRFALFISLAMLLLSILACNTPAPAVTQEATVETGSTASPTTVVLPSPTIVNEPTIIPSPTAVPITVETLSGISFHLPLVIQHAAETSAVLFFELAQPSPGALLITQMEDPGNQQLITLNESETRHQITVKNLVSGTRYVAVVALGDDPADYAQPHLLDRVWGPVRFSTVSSEEPIRIGVMGDSGFGKEVTYQMAASMVANDIDFAVNTGDIVYQVYNNESPVDAFIEKWYLPLESLLTQMPVYPVVGNHDIEQATRVDGVPFYYLAFPAFTAPLLEPSTFEGRNQWYAFAINDWQFLMLDTQTFYAEAGRAEQSAWLNERLADPRFAHTIPVFHVPPYSSGGVHQGDGLPVREWVPIIEAANVPLVLNGHSHNYERLQVGSVTYIVSGGGSRTLYSEGERVPESQVFAARSHYVLLELYSDRIELRSIADNGDILDQTSIPVE